MSTQMLSCNEKFYGAINDVLGGKEDVSVVEMTGGTPAIHKNAAIKFTASIKSVIEDKNITPSVKLERIDTLIAYVERYENDKKTLKEKAQAAETKAVAAAAALADKEKELEVLKKSFEEKLKAELAKHQASAAPDKKSNKK